MTFSVFESSCHCYYHLTTKGRGNLATYLQLLEKQQANLLVYLYDYCFNV